MEDRQIVTLLWNRMESAIDALRNKFGKRLYQIAINILADPMDAQEAENDTYLALWNTIPPHRPDPLPPFVYRVGRNTALDHYRRRAAKKRDSRYDLCLGELSEVIPGDSLEALMDARELGRAINRFLSELDKETRVLFVRRYWFGDDIPSLAKAMGITQGAVSVRLHRTRAKLKDYLYKEGFWL